MSMMQLRGMYTHGFSVTVNSEVITAGRRRGENRWARARRREEGEKKRGKQEQSNKREGLRNEGIRSGRVEE